jgi:hypothetical protein
LIVIGTNKYKRYLMRNLHHAKFSWWSTTFTRTLMGKSIS